MRCKQRKSKRTLHRLHYFSKWHTGVRDTGTKSRNRFQKLINSGILDIFCPIEYYRNKKEL